MRDRPMSAGDDREARRRASRCAHAGTRDRHLRGEGRADRAGAGTRGEARRRRRKRGLRGHQRANVRSPRRKVRSRGLGPAFCRKASVRFGRVRLLRAPPGDGGERHRAGLARRRDCARRRRRRARRRRRLHGRVRGTRRVRRADPWRRGETSALRRESLAVATRDGACVWEPFALVPAGRAIFSVATVASAASAENGGASRSPSSRGRTRGNPPAAIPGSPQPRRAIGSDSRGFVTAAFATTRLSPCAPRFSVSARNAPRRARTSSGARRRRG